MRPLQRARLVRDEHVAVDTRAAAWERLDCRRARRRRRLAVSRIRSEAEEAEAADLRVFLVADREKQRVARLRLEESLEAERRERARLDRRRPPR